jgi:hypothetical protein
MTLATHNARAGCQLHRGCCDPTRRAVSRAQLPRPVFELPSHRAPLVVRVQPSRAAHGRGVFWKRIVGDPELASLARHVKAAQRISDSGHWAFGRSADAERAISGWGLFPRFGWGFFRRAGWKRCELRDALASSLREERLRAKRWDGEW